MEGKGKTFMFLGAFKINQKAKTIRKNKKIECDAPGNKD